MKVPIPDEEEDLIHNYIIHTYLTKVLQNDLKTIEQANFKLNEPYIKLVEHNLKKIRLELRNMKDEMQKLDIQVEEPFLDDAEFWQYDFYVRGFHGVKRYWEAALNMHGIELLNKYFKGDGEYG